jgi:hypothetical protein
MGLGKQTPPYMGVSVLAFLEQLSEFSTPDSVYPQFLGTYPQDGEFYMRFMWFRISHIWRALQAVLDAVFVEQFFQNIQVVVEALQA